MKNYKIKGDYEQFIERMNRILNGGYKYELR